MKASRSFLPLAVVALFSGAACSADDATIVVSTPSAYVVVGARGSATTSNAVAVLRTYDAFRERLTRAPSTRGAAGWTKAGALSVRLPTSERASVRLSVEGDPDVSLEIAAEEDAHVSVLESEGTITLASARPDTDVVHVADAEGAEEIRLLRSPAAPTLTRYRLDRGPGVSAIRVESGRVQVLDAKGSPRIESAPMFAVDAHGTRREVTVSLGADGATLTASLDATGLAYPIAVDPMWATTGSMTEARDEHRAVLLTDGRVFVTGSYGSTAELYDPTKATWSAALSLTATRSRPALAALGTKVLLAGGGSGVLNAQTYDAVANTWATSGTPPSPARDAATLTVLASGKVLLVGGYDAGASLTTAAVYDPATTGWTAVASMTVGRNDHKATLLGSGKVLVVCGNLTSTAAELYDPVANKWTAAGTMSVARTKCTSTLLPSGKVLVHNGGAADIYDPTTNAWTTPATSSVLRGGAQTATLLASGKVLIAGGTSGAYIYTRATELFDPVANTFTAIEDMATGRGDPAAVRLLDGRVLVSGGKTGKGLSTASSEIYGGELGVGCLKNDGCGSGFCTDGVCCSTASCAAGSFCNTPAKPGTCALLTATACTKPSDCATGFCVDGVCCFSACNNQCEACDTDTAKGKCVPISGAPHGTRAKCDTGAGDVCAARACDGSKDDTKCVGYVSGASAVCKPPTCVGSTYIGPSTCDGTGGCATPKEVVCDPYLCADTGCKTSCTTASECLKGYECKAGVCSATGAQCINDGAQSKAKDGTITDCRPFRCTASQTCGSACVAAADCLTGFVCDVASKNCVDPNASTGSSGGCQAGHGDGQGGMVALLSLLLALGVRRRRCD
jgi:uncharacterized protein (TIGR03382 family)